jgi:hypothetical protein
MKLTRSVRGAPVDQASLRRGEGPGAGGGVKPLQGERLPGAVPDEPLETRPVLALEAAGLEKPDSPLDVARDHAVEGQHVVVIVRVERAPEALREGDGPELRVANGGWSTRTRVTERGPEPPEEDAEYRVRPDRESRAIAGLSMGGSQALHIGLNHRELFAHVAAFGGALIMYGGRYGEWFPRRSVAGPDVPQSLYSSVGSGDFLLGVNRSFAGWLNGSARRATWWP